MQPATKHAPCPICKGHRDLPQGKGVRCYGYISTDGEFAHCTRGELAGGIPLHKGDKGGESYPHRLNGQCKCGTQHGAEVRGIGESKRAEIVDTYDYRDARGELRYQVVRTHPKGFRQRRPDGKGGWLWKLEGVEPLIYKLPEVIEAIAAGDPIYIAEGEKDVNALMRAGVVATCNSGGAGKWPATMSQHLKGADVIMVRDKDEAGHAHARDVYAKLRGLVKSFRVVEALRGKDAADHLVVGHNVDEFVPVWPLDGLKQGNPVEWKRAILRTSMEVEEPLRIVKYADAIQKPELPTWPTGLEGPINRLVNFRGVSIVAGEPSAGKSFLSIASSIKAAQIDDWQVLYIVAEMGEAQVARRARAFCDGPPPDEWEMIVADFGADIGPLVELICSRVTERRTLIVIDSISSFVDQAKVNPNPDDPHGLTLLRRMIMWAMNVKRKTDGQVSFMILSELNKDGRTKGRFGDYKADVVVSMETDIAESLLKTLKIVKGWEYQTGEVGTYLLNPATATLSWKQGPTS